MKRLKGVENGQVSLEVGECDCGYHFGVDATYLDGVVDADFTFNCPNCGEEIDTSKLFPEDDKEPNGLTPPDRARCQAEITPGSFMTLGPRTTERCKNKPSCIITENQPGKDGKVGSMSLCEDCLKVFLDRFGDDFATVNKKFYVYVKDRSTLRYSVYAESAEEAREAVEASEDVDEEFEREFMECAEWYVDKVEEA